MRSNRCGVALRAWICFPLLGLALGCGSAEQQYAQPEGGTVAAPTATETVRSWLEGIAESGVLDSGSIVLKENIERMKAEGANVDALTKSADELLAMHDAGRIKAKAKEMIAELPK